MNENSKTIAFVAAAAVIGVVAFVSRPTLPTREAGDVTGQMLYPEFKDPTKATSLEIVDFDESTGTVRPFQVAQVNGVWSIPSHETYPADAEKQMGQAAKSVMDLKILQVVSDSPGDHGEYGVVDPDPKSLKPGATGVGTRVAMKDSAGKPLLSLIVGKAVPGKTELHYVRRSGEDQVYVVKIDTGKLTAKFEDWIEKNLLKMDTLDFQGVKINDYSVDVLRGRLNPRGRTELKYNDSGDPKWSLVDGLITEKGKDVPLKLAADEELNTSKLDDLKFALNDLKIVDVSRKPKGLSTDLKATRDFTDNQEAVQSLAQRGFYVANVGNNVDLFSNEGEIRATMKTGVDYVLRFGSIAGDSGAGKKADAKDAKDAKGEKKAEGKDEKKDASRPGMNRYIFVTAQFNPNVIPKPALEPLPKDEPKKEEAKKDDKKADPKAASKDSKPGDKAKKDEKKPDDKAKADPKKPEEKAKQATPEKKSEPKPDLKAERERIEKDNKRKQEEYDEKVKKGQEKVKELNTRFADWYYVISDDVYKKIHLTRAEIVKKKEKKDGEKKDEAAAHDHDKEVKTSTGTAPTDFDKLKSSLPGKK